MPIPPYDELMLPVLRHSAEQTWSMRTLIARTAGDLHLTDGAELTNLLVRFNVGVRTARTVEIKRVDLDYFEQTEPE